MYDLNAIRLVLEDIRNEIDKDSWLAIQLCDTSLEIRLTTFAGDKVKNTFNKVFTKKDILSAKPDFDLIKKVLIPEAKAMLKD